MVPTAVCRLAALAVTFKLVPTVPGLTVMRLAAESVVTTADVPAFNVNWVAVVLPMRMLFAVAVALNDPVVRSPTVVTCVAASSTAEVVAVRAFVRLMAPEVEVNVRLFVLMVPMPASAMVAPAFIVTELVPFSVPFTVTACVASASAVRVMSEA